MLIDVETGNNSLRVILVSISFVFLCLGSHYLIVEIMTGGSPLFFRFLTHGFSFEIDAMGTIAQTIQDSIRNGPFSNKFVPLVDRKLGANDG